MQPVLVGLEVIEHGGLEFFLLSCCITSYYCQQYESRGWLPAVGTAF